MQYRTGGVLYLLATLLPVVLGFTFPDDWQKIKTSMLERKREQELESLDGVRFGFPAEEEEEVEEHEVRPTVSRTLTTAPPPLPLLDPVMEEIMRFINFTELQLFTDDSKLLGRNSFEDPPPAAFRVGEAVWRLTRGLVRGGLYDLSSGNSLFSPISILTTLNMLLMGTAGTTREEILTTLGYPRYTGPVHYQFREVLHSMANEIGVSLATSHAIFCQARFPLQQTYRAELSEYYGDSMELVHLDFTRRPITTMRIMNGFVAQRTNNLIQNMFTQPVPADSRLVLSNALYFNGSWEYKFLFSPPEYSGIKTTFVSFNKSLNLTLMTATLDFPYLEEKAAGFRIASLPYENAGGMEGFSEAHMFLIQPIQSGADAFLAVEKQLDSLDWEEVFEKMSPVFGEIHLPRMKMEFQANLADYLAELGLKKLFSGPGNPDMAPLTPQWQQLSLDTLQHKTVLKITEKGTEAAAATSAFHFRMIPHTILRFDRPFFLFIYDALNKVVIFWSRVVEPEPIHD